MHWCTVSSLVHWLICQCFYFHLQVEKSAKRRCLNSEGMETDSVTMETQSFPVPDHCLSRSSPQRLPIDHSQHINLSQVVHNRPKLKFYLFPLTRSTLKKGLTQKIYFNFQSRIFFFNFIAYVENCPM